MLLNFSGNEKWWLYLEKTSKYNNLFFSVVVFLCLFAILFFSPYATDDYGEKFTAFNATWKDCFIGAIRYGNGRFLGNIGLYACLHSDWVRILSKPLITLSLVLSVIYLFDIKKLWEKVMAVVFLVFPCHGFFSYCIIETPCFFNYVAPISFFGISLVILKYLNNKEKTNIFLLILLIAIGFCMQLFSENSTFIFLFSTLILLIYDFISKKRIKSNTLVLLLSEIVGLVTMFTLPSIIEKNFTLKYQMNNYRSIVFSISNIVSVLAKFAEMFSSAFVVIAALSAVEIYLVLKESQDDQFRLIHIIVPVAYSILSLLYSLTQNNEEKINSLVKIILLLSLTAFVINTIVITLRFIKSFEYKFTLISLLLLSMISVGIFTLLDKHGYRTFYLSIVLIICFFCVLYSYIKREFNVNIQFQHNKALNIAVSIGLICFALVTSLQMIQNYDVLLMREIYISEKSELGDKIVYIPKLPNRNLYREEYMIYCKQYYCDRYNIEKIVFIDIEDWEMYNKYASLQSSPLKGVKYVFENFNFNNGLK